MINLSIFKKNLTDFLKNSEGDDNEKLRIICDKLQKKEDENMVNKDLAPKKEPAMLLKVEVPGVIPLKDVCFLCLEKDFNEYIVSLWVKQKDSSTPCKRTICWETKETRYDKVLGEFQKLIESFVERK